MGVCTIKAYNEFSADERRLMESKKFQVLESLSPRTMSLVTDIPSPENWCAPAIGIYVGCPAEYRSSFLIHNWVVFATNMLSVVVLLIVLLIRFNFGRLASANVYFVTSAMCMLGNICTFSRISTNDGFPFPLRTREISQDGWLFSSGHPPLPHINYALLIPARNDR